jgi:hypothetical protein
MDGKPPFRYFETGMMDHLITRMSSLTFRAKMPPGFLYRRGTRCLNIAVPEDRGPDSRTGRRPVKCSVLAVAESSLTPLCVLFFRGAHPSGS